MKDTLRRYSTLTRQVVESAYMATAMGAFCFYVMVADAVRKARVE